MNRYFETVENMMEHFTKEPYLDEVLAAKNLFFKTAGVMDEAAENFEQKMNQFADWYLFRRPLSQSQKTPVELVLAGEVSEIHLPENQKQGLRHNRHSLFEFQKGTDQEVILKDLFTGEKLTLSTSSRGFTKSEIFEARIFKEGEELLFGPSFCFHPPQVSKFILKEVKKIKKLPEDQKLEEKQHLISRLYRMRSKFDQYQHVGLMEIYSNESKLGL